MTEWSAIEMPEVAPIEVPEPILALACEARRVVVLTGAGMSAESGIPTFRDPETGLWSRFDASTLASPEGWAADPHLVWAWYAWRAHRLSTISPNPGHLALARWATLPGVDLQIATQNIDDLHERSGSSVLTHVHGSLLQFRCSVCEAPFAEPVVVPDEPVERLEPPGCPECGEYVRPCVVWFGEMLPEGAMEAAAEACAQADLVLVVGTSGIVYPFAGLPLYARNAGVPVIEINPEETSVTDLVDLSWRATAGTALPSLVAALEGEAHS